MVVVLENYLGIETGELGQMLVVFSALKTEDFVHPLHIDIDGHLLGWLRRMCQKGGLTEVVNLEHGRARLSSNGLEFQTLDLGKTLQIEEGSEEVGDTGANMENRVGDQSVEVNDVIGKACCLTDTRLVGVGSDEFNKGTSRILDLEQKRRCGVVIT